MFQVGKDDFKIVLEKLNGETGQSFINHYHIKQLMVQLDEEPFLIVMVVKDLVFWKLNSFLNAACHSNTPLSKSSELQSLKDVYNLFFFIVFCITV